MPVAAPRQPDVPRPAQPQVPRPAQPQAPKPPQAAAQPIRPTPPNVVRPATPAGNEKTGGNQITIEGGREGRSGGTNHGGTTICTNGVCKELGLLELAERSTVRTFYKMFGLTQFV